MPQNKHSIMKRFELTYNGVTSVFNAFENGQGKTMTGSKTNSWWVLYSVRPSKTNTLGISGLIESHKEDGSIKWSFYSRVRVERGHKVFVKELR